MSNNNPYASATNAYSSTAAASDQRALEAKALFKAAQKIEDIMNRMNKGEEVSFLDVGEALEHNQKLWLLFVNDAMNEEHPLPVELKSNIASLGVFIFKRTKDLLIDSKPQNMKVLIDINRNIASGLMKRPAAPIQPNSPLSADTGASSSTSQDSTDIMS